MRTLLSFRIAYAHVRATLGRMALAVVALALGVALVVAVQVMNVSVLDAFLDAIDDMAGHAQLSITALDGVPFDESVAARVASVVGVGKAIPIVTGVAFRDDHSDEVLTVHAMDLSDPEAVEVYHRGDTRNIIPDRTSFFLKLNSIVLAREYAARHGLRLGSSFTLVTPKGLQEFTVRGLLDPQGLAKTLDGRLVVMDVYAAEQFFTADGQINRIDIVTKDRDEDDVQKAVQAVLPAGLTVEQSSIRRDVTRKAFAALQALLTAFSLLIVVVGFVICYGRLSAVFEARTWEVGLIRAVGLSRLSVFSELLKESLVIGALGTALGIPIGIAIGRVGLPIVATTTALQYHSSAPAAELVIPLHALLLGLGVGIGAAILAAAAPALRLARTEPVAALTLRGREAPSALAPVRKIIVAGLLIGAAALIIGELLSGYAPLGHLTTVALAVAACVGSRPVVQHGTHLLGVLWYRCFGTYGLLTARRLGEQGRRASLTVATLGLGLGLVLMFGILVQSFERSVVVQIASKLRADLIVTSPHVSAGWTNAALSEDVVAQIAGLPGVAAAIGQARRDVTIGGRSVGLHGYDRACFSDDSLCNWPLDRGAPSDALNVVARGEAVLVAGPLAQLLHARVGDVIAVPSPNGLQSLRVAGITSAEPEPAIVMSRDLYRATWNDHQVIWIHVSVGNGNTTEQISQRIEQGPGTQYRLLVRTKQRLLDFFADQARVAFRVVYPMEAVTLLLVLISIGDTLASSVLERTRELGMMRAVGLRRSRLFGMVMLEACTIGLLGLALAAAVGLSLGVFWVEVQFPALLGWVLDLYVPYRLVVAGAGLALVLCLIGAVLPAVRAAYISVPAALRNE